MFHAHLLYLTSVMQVMLVTRCLVLFTFLPCAEQLVRPGIGQAGTTMFNQCNRREFRLHLL